MRGCVAWGAVREVEGARLVVEDTHGTDASGLEGAGRGVKQEVGRTAGSGGAGALGLKG